MRRGQVGAVVACVGAVLLGWAALSTSWFRAEIMGLAEVNVGLRAASVCVMDECQLRPLGAVLARHGGLYRLVGWLTSASALLGAGLAIAGAVAHWRRFDPRPMRWALRVAGLAGAGALLAFFTFPGAGVEVAAGFWLALGGALTICAGAIAVLLPDEGWMNAPFPSALPAARTLTPVAPPGATAPVFAASAASVPEAVRRRRETELGEGILRHVVRQLELSEAGVRASSDGGGTRALAWAELAEVVALQLPPGTPHGRLVLVDLVPRSGPPVRVTPTTRANYAALPGAGTTSIENFRRLVAYAQAHAPLAGVDADTAAFASGRAPAAFPSLAAFASYDARWSPG